MIATSLSADVMKVTMHGPCVAFTHGRNRCMVVVQSVEPLARTTRLKRLLRPANLRQRSLGQILNKSLIRQYLGAKSWQLQSESEARKERIIVRSGDFVHRICR